MPEIHSTAIVAPGAQIADNVVIGPYCVVSDRAVVGPGCELLSHVVLEGNVTLGKNNRVHSFAVLGGRTQDLKFKGGDPGVVIGDNNVFREYVTVNAATNDGDYTTIGNDCLLMAYAHVAHCCRIGNGVIIANACQIAGHVRIDDMATIEGVVGVVQFLHVGKLAFVGAMSKITKDLPPFMIADGFPAEVRSFNRIGMERRGVDEAGRKAVKEAYRILYRQERDRPTAQALERIEAEVPQTPETRQLVEFCRNSEKGIIR